MEWQFKVAIGAAILFGLLPYLVKDMPLSITYSGIFGAILFGLWGIPWAAQRIPAWPGLLLILSCCGAVAATTLLIQSWNEKKLSIWAVTSSAEYPSGTMVGGIEFRPEFTEATVIIKNAADEGMDDINLLLQFDQAIAGIAQQSAIPNVSFEEKNGMSAGFMLSDPKTGKAIRVPSIVLLATDAGYRMRCPHLASGATIRLVVALTNITPPAHPDYSNLPFDEQVTKKEIVATIKTGAGETYWMGHRDGDVYGPRLPPQWLKTDGAYELSKVSHTMSQKIEFSPMAFNQPWKFLEGIIGTPRQ